MYSLMSYKCDDCYALLMACCGVIFFAVAHFLNLSIFEVISEDY